MSRYKPYTCRPRHKKKPDLNYTKDDLSFAKEPPEDISQTSCGHRFCTSCIKEHDESSPKCRATPYQIFPDTDRQRIISGLQVYCSNKKDGCTWKGELKNLSGHINKGKREGDCQFEVVKCRYWGSDVFTGCCNVEMKRADLANHEENECTSRPYTCQYCEDKTTHFRMTAHYKCCPKFPVTCPNECDPKKTMPREEVDAHIKNDCPLEPVACELCWAGCTARPQRKNIEKHTATNIVRHFKLVAKACGELNKRCNKLEEVNAELRESNLELKEIISRNGLK